MEALQSITTNDKAKTNGKQNRIVKKVLSAEQCQPFRSQSNINKRAAIPDISILGVL